ncbi:MAG: uroporphyrinogen decarboxylase [Candidatus Methylacidiphilales bacterium]
MTSRQRFLNALEGLPVDRPPVWIMRQAGRYLPEYRALKEIHTFREMVETPDLAVEITLMPLRRYALDAAITFSDILVVPQALGVDYHFDNSKGISMPAPLRSAEDINQLDGRDLIARLDYVMEAQRRLRKELGNDHALLGFSGTPWTLATYMIDGSGAHHAEVTKALALAQPAAFQKLLEMLTAAVGEYLEAQALAGVDAVQLFDSAAPACPGAQYEEWSLRWSRQIISRLKARVPVILFVRGMGSHLDALADSGARALGLDWTHDLPVSARRVASRTGVQGNLDPCLLGLEPERVVEATRALLESMTDHHGYIFNLGHGILPTARTESVAALVETVVTWRQ